MRKNLLSRNAIWLILGLALALRLIGLNKSFQGDEFFSVLDARNFAGIIKALMSDTHPPLYFYMLHFWMKLSMQEAFLRLLSIIPGVGVCYLGYVIGRKTTNELTGLAAALLIACAPAAIWSSQYIRTYSWAGFFFVLSVYCVIVLMQNKGKGRFYWFCFVLATAGSMYTFYFSFLSIIALNLFVYFYMRKNIIFVTRWIAATAAVALVYLPWLPYFLLQRGSYLAHPQMVEKVGFYIGTIHVGAVLRSIAGILGVDPGFMFNGLFSQNRMLICCATLFLIGLAVCAAVFFVYVLRSQMGIGERNIYVRLFFVLSVVPFLIAVILHQVFKIILMSHYFFVGFIFLILFALGALAKVESRRVRNAAFVAVVALYSVRLVALYSDKGADFKSAHDYLSKVVRSDTIMFAPSQHAFGAIVGHYLSKDAKIYYVENDDPIVIANKHALLITYKNKLELKKYDDKTHLFLTTHNYRYVATQHFSDLVIEEYILPAAG
jgi:uncharacterized membrane protein